MAPDQSLSGKCALVTGGAKRIGRAITLALAKAGADVTITYRSSSSEAIEAVSEVEGLGRRAQALSCDVRSESSVRDCIAASVAFHRRLDIVVNNAAIFETSALDSLTLDQWDEVFATNARGPFLVAREAIPHLRAARGRIVNMGSLGGIHPWAGHGHYCASKAAVHMLTQVMAKSFAPEVSVNCVAPGWIEIADAETDRASRFAARTPMLRNGKAEDVADAVLFFAAGGDYFTGQILVVDGGVGL